MFKEVSIRFVKKQIYPMSDARAFPSLQGALRNRLALLQRRSVHGDADILIPPTVSLLHVTPSPGSPSTWRPAVAVSWSR